MPIKINTKPYRQNLSRGHLEIIADQIGRAGLPRLASQKPWSHVDLREYVPPCQGVVTSVVMLTES